MLHSFHILRILVEHRIRKGLKLECHTLDTFQNGWIVGNFEPSLWKTADFEVAIKHYKSGQKEPSHAQIIATEVTVVISGKIRMGAKYFIEQEIAVIPPGEFCDFEAITDCVLVCIKSPSLPEDKILQIN